MKVVPRPSSDSTRDPPVVALDDPVGQRQAEARSHADGLGGEEGIEDAALHLFRRCRARRRGTSRRTPSVGGPGDDPNRSPLFDRVAGVDEEVQEDLVELPGVAAHAGEIAVVALDLDAVLQARLHQRERSVDLFVEVDLLQLRVVHAREGPQVLHDLLDALGALAASREQLRDRLDDSFAVALAARAVDQLLHVLVEELEIGVNESDRVVELMSDAGHELTQGFHLLGLQELSLGLA